jgi:hypothetical protein
MKLHLILAAVVALLLAAAPSFADPSAGSPKPADPKVVQKVQEYLRPFRKLETPLRRVRRFETHLYGQLNSRGVRGDDLTPDHIPSRAAVQRAVEEILGRKLTRQERRALNNRLPTIVVPDAVHRDGPTYGSKNTQAQIESDSRDLRAAFERDVAALRTNALKRGYPADEVDRGIRHLRVRVEKLLRDLGYPPAGGSGGGSSSSGANTGPYTEMLQKVEEHTDGASDRHVRFARSLTGKPIFGGIVLGNRTHRDSVVLLGARITVEAGKPCLRLQIRRGRGVQEVRYTDMSPTELWCAYHIVRPTPSMKTQYGLRDAECNLVSCRQTPLGNGHFALHPALANTRVGQAAMQLDFLILTSVAGSIPGLKEKLLAGQWYDAPALFRVRDGQLSVEPAEGPKQTLLRLRLYGLASTPPWMRKERTQQELLHLRASVMRSLRRLLEGPNAPAYLARPHLQDEAFWMPVLAPYAGNLSFDFARAMSRYFEEHPCVRSVDRFARLLAVLNWIGDVRPFDFPALPAGVLPERIDLPPRLRPADVSAQRQPDPRFVRPDPIQVGVKYDREQWWLFRLHGKTVGRRRVLSRTFREAGEQRREIVALDEVSMTRGGQAIRQAITSQIVTTPANQLVRYRHEQSAGGAEKIAFTLESSGKGFEVTLNLDGKTIKEPVPYSRDARVLEEYLHSAGPFPIRPGEKQAVFLIDMLGNRTHDKLEAVRREKTLLIAGEAELLRVETGHTTFWIDQDGKVRKYLAQKQMECLCCTREQALDDSTPAEMIAAFPLARPLPEHADNGRMRLRIRARERDLIRLIPSNVHQHVRLIDPHTAEIELRPTYHHGPVSLFAHRDGSQDRKYLRPSRHVQSEDSQVIALARRAAGTIKDPWRRALHLEGTVVDHLRQGDYTSPASAAGTAATGRGDCRSTAMLLAAAARALGIPARLMCGLLYSAADQSFVGHLWTEVWLHDRWTPLDGTLGLGGVGATHLALYVLDDSAIDKPVQIERLLRPGAMTLEVLLCVSGSPWWKAQVDSTKRDEYRGRKVSAEERRQGIHRAFRLATLRCVIAASHLNEVDCTQARKNAGGLAKLLDVPACAPHWSIQGSPLLDPLNGLHHVLVQEARTIRCLRQSWGAEVAAAYTVACRLNLLCQVETFNLDAETASEVSRPLGSAAKEAGLPAEELRKLLDLVARGVALKEIAREAKVVQERWAQARSR